MKKKDRLTSSASKGRTSQLRSKSKTVFVIGQWTEISKSVGFVNLDILQNMERRGNLTTVNVTVLTCTLIVY